MVATKPATGMVEVLAAVAAVTTIGTATSQTIATITAVVAIISSNITITVPEETTVVEVAMVTDVAMIIAVVEATVAVVVVIVTIRGTGTVEGKGSQQRLSRMLVEHTLHQLGPLLLDITTIAAIQTVATINSRIIPTTDTTRDAVIAVVSPR